MGPMLCLPRDGDCGPNGRQELICRYLHATPSSDTKGKIISVFELLGVYFMLGINTTQLVCEIKRVNACDLKLLGFYKTRFLGSKN